jgi:A/G-specific adenine glycosylase
VAQGLPYFERYLKYYPTLKDLALAPSEEVMRLWQGLGYYSRARNLHDCAKDLHYNNGGNFPENYAELLKLKGVGTYTAAAIASFAFEEPVAVVDGNVFRVLSRYFGIGTDITSTRGKKEFEQLANRIIPQERPGEFNQAIMEFGALQCVPKNPDCENCPLKISCFAYHKSMVGELPVKAKKLKIRERYFQYYHIVCGEYTVVKKRAEGDIWQGLYDFPLEEGEEFLKNNSNLPQFLNHILNFGTLDVIIDEHIYKHILTHQRIFANFVKFVVDEKSRFGLERWVSSNNFQLVDLPDLENLAKPRLILKYLNEEK